MNFSDANDMKEKLQEVIIPNSSIGLYTIYDYNEIENLSDKIFDMMRFGIKHKSRTNIFNDIRILGNDEDYDYREIYNNTFISLIIAIPETLTDTKGRKYYLGNYDFLDARKRKLHDREKEYFNDMWLFNYMEHCQYFPKEFILGVSLSDRNTGKTKVILNPKYIGLQEESKKRDITDELLERYPKKVTGKLLTSVIDEENIDKVYQSVTNNVELEHQRGRTDYFSEGFKRYLERNYDLERNKKM